MGFLWEKLVTGSGPMRNGQINATQKVPILSFINNPLSGHLTPI